MRIVPDMAEPERSVPIEGSVRHPHLALIGTPMLTTPHTHRWVTTSRHRTSEGLVAYDHCACGRWRVRRDPTVGVEQTLVIAPADTKITNCQ